MDNWLRVYEIANKKVRELKDVRDMGSLTFTQENSYINQAFTRQAEQDDITLDEAMSLAAGLISAGVDTTSNMLSWRILHVALHPEVQEKLYAELIQLVDENGHLTEESMSPSNSPYLHACMRESHRCGNAVPVVPIKRFETEVEVHGVTLPPGSVVALDSYSTGVDPSLVDDPADYRPERFLPDAIEARRGTASEVIDHAFFSGPFSQGARRCPGSRVANLEAHVLVAQLVLDWKMSIPSLKHWSECPYDMETLMMVHLPPIEFTRRT
jgi:cytochrome P450